MPADGFWNVHAFSGDSKIAVRPEPVEHPDSVRFMLADLARSGLLPQDIDAYAIAPDRGVPQYVIPYPQDGMYRSKREDPKFKYRAPQGRNEVWYSSNQVYDSFRSSPLLLIVEGEKKAARAVKEWPDIPVLAIGGVWNGTLKQADGTHRLHETILNAVAPYQKIKIIFDNDILERDDLQKAAYTLHLLLTKQFCQVELLVPPRGTKGLDDYLVARQSLPHCGFEEVGLIQVPFDDLAPTRVALVEELGLAVNSEGGIIISSTNYAKLFHKFVGPTVKFDRRLGFVGNKTSINISDYRIDFIKYIERLGLKNYPIHIDFALSSFVRDATTDVLMEEILSVTWDGIPRLYTWGSKYIPNTHNYPALSNEWGRLLMTGLAMRLVEPGTKFDYVMFLVGPQGTYKTTFFEKLATFKCGRFYGTVEKVGTDDGAKRTLGTKVKRNIILDFSESSVLDGRQTSIEALKSFVTQTEDEYREVYAKDLIQTPRSFVFVGTSNKHNQLFDTTGTRRWAMLDVKDCVQPLEYEVKMQILAEAIYLLPQIKQTNWYEFNLSWDEIPHEIVNDIDNEGYVPNVNLSEGNQILEGLNRKHIREDPNIAELKMLLESPEDNFPVLYSEPDKFMTTTQHLAMILDMTKKEVTTMLRRLQDDPHFPWNIEVGTTMTLTSFSYPRNVSMTQFTTGMSQQVKPFWLTRK